MAFAQEGESPNNAPSSSLGLSSVRSQQERIEFFLQVASAYTGEQDIMAAIDAYERILRIDPTHQQARYIVAHLYISNKQYQKADANLKSLIIEQPNDFQLLNNIAWLYATAEDPSIRNGKLAIKYAQEALTLAPTDYHVWSTLSEAYYVSGDYEKALRAVTQMASIATRFGTDITEESVKKYNKQIQKCKRAVDTADVMNDDE